MELVVARRDQRVVARLAEGSRRREEGRAVLEHQAHGVVIIIHSGVRVDRVVAAALDGVRDRRERGPLKGGARTGQGREELVILAARPRARKHIFSRGSHGGAGDYSDLGAKIEWGGGRGSRRERTSTGF